MAEENTPGNADPDNVNNGKGENEAKSTPQSSWLDNLSDDFRKIAEAKAWKTENDVIKSYSELEKHASAKMSIPKDGDAEGWNKLYNLLGRPENASGYDLKDTQQIDEPYLEQFKAVAHEAGLSNAAVNKIYQGYVKMTADRAKANTDAFNKQVEAGQAKLKEEWGDKYQDNFNTMQKGYRAFLPLLGGEKALTNLELAMGTENFMRFGLKLGSITSEDMPNLGGKQPTSEEMDPEDFFNGIMQVKKE